MALSLECFCPGSVDVVLCEPVAVIFHLDLSNAYGTSGQTAAVFVTLDGGRPGTGYADAWGNGAIGIVRDIQLNTAATIADWDLLRIRFTYDGNGTTGCIASAKFAASFQLRIGYSCADHLPEGPAPITYVDAINADTDICANLTGPEDCPLRSAVKLNSGSASGIMQKKGALADNSCSAEGGNFQPEPAVYIKGKDLHGPGGCLCATGGTPPYFFYIVSGHLPCNRTLDNFGCLTAGTFPCFDFQQHTNIVYGVMDAEGATAEVTCDYFWPTCTEEAIGNVSF